jgi:hypothetical protein
MRKDNKYIYQVRFDKKVPLHKKALDNLDKFCSITKMTMKDSIILMLASTNTEYLVNQLLNVGNAPLESYQQSKKANEDPKAPEMLENTKEASKEEKKEIISPAITPITENEEVDVQETMSDMNLADIFDNFSL